ncbi:hypothetical protein F5I97DRAFT_2038995 [Phlebopus sp. FC_14]|nr:hypothetical protein F5I97DRAFT_2038995 [Phlebopus sp. FC_14]
MAPQVWFITGASSGFGRYMTELLLKKRDKVVVTLRKPEVIYDLVQQYTSEQLLVMGVDVTQSSQVADAFDKAKQKYGEVARSLFETNFWGPVTVSTEADKFFRDVNQPQGGRLLQISSLAAIANLPWKGSITIVAPGTFRTDVLDKNNVEPLHPAYTASARQRLYFAKNEIDGDGRKAVAVMEKLTHLENPPLRFPIHKGSIAFSRLKAGRIQKEADEYEGWSEDVYLG